MQVLKIIKGDSLTIPIINSLPNGAWLNITGYTFYFTIKNKPDSDSNDSTAIYKKTWIVHSNPTLGQTILSLTAEESNSIPAGNYYADVQWKAPNGQIKTPAIFTFSVQNAVTNRTN